jgi:DNA-binding beta-propeller fold protein YncE
MLAMLTGIVSRLGSLAVIAAAVAALTGCGSAPVDELPPAAGPDASPPLAERPAGRVVPVGNGPEGVAADPVTGLVAVGLRDPAALALVDARSGRVKARVPLSGAPRHLGLGGAGGPVLVPTGSGDDLARVALPSGSIESAPAGASPHDAAVAAGRAAEVDGGRAIAVLSPRERVLELYDSRTRERIARAPAGAGPTHVVAGEGGLAYVVDTAGDGLLVFETRGELRVRRRYPLLGAPYGIVSDLRNGRMWVTLTARNELVELATGSRPHRLAAYPTVRQPNTVAVDPVSGRVFVTGKVDGVLQLLDPRRSR